MYLPPSLSLYSYDLLNIFTSNNDKWYTVQCNDTTTNKWMLNQNSSQWRPHMRGKYAVANTFEVDEKLYLMMLKVILKKH